MQLFGHLLAERADLVERDGLIHGDEAAYLGVLNIASALPALGLKLARQQAREALYAQKAPQCRKQQHKAHGEEY